MSEASDRDFRGFLRYENDGLANAPTDAPLPFGDPTSGVKNIGKAALRARFADIDATAASIEATRAYVEGIIGDAVSASEVPIFQTVATVQAIPGGVPIGMNVIRVTGRLTAGAGGGTFKRVAGTSTKTGAFEDDDGVWFEPTVDPGALQILDASTVVTVGIGTTGDFPDLTTAVTALSNYNAHGGQIELRMVSPCTSGLYVRRGDYSKFYITSDIGVVGLDVGFTGPSDAAIGVPADDIDNNLIMGLDCRMPRLGCVFDMGGLFGSGYYGVWGCTGFVMPSCGVINAGYQGLVFRCGAVVAHQTVWSGANQAGIRAAYTASIAAQSADASNCCQNSDTGNPSQGAVDVSRTSMVHFRLGDASGSGNAAINCRRNSTVCFQEADCSGAAFSNVLFTHSSRGSGFGANMSGATGATGGSGLGRGCVVETGSCVDITGAVVENNSVRDLEVNSGGMIVAEGVTTTNGGMPSIQNVNVPTFNVWTSRGIIINSNGALMNWGRFSSTGAANGKDLIDDTVLSSSRTTTATIAHYNFHNPNGYVGGIRTDGSGAFFDSTSDERLKVNRRQLGDEMDVDGILDAIEAIGFDWLSAVTMEPTGERGYGFLAQAVHAVYPPAVNIGQGEPGEPDFRPWTIDMSRLIPLLIASRRNQRPRMSNLEYRLHLLEGKI